MSDNGHRDSRSSSRDSGRSVERRSVERRSVERSPHSDRSRKSHTPSRSASRSRYESKSRSRSRSRSYSRSHKKRRRSRSRSPGYRKYSRSRSRSPYHKKRRRRRSSGDRYGGFRGRSKSPMSSRRRHFGDRDNPEPSKCVGVFGLSLYTQERTLREVFGRYGSLEEVQVVYDRQTGRSRGFAFIYFRNIDDSIEAKDRCNSLEIDGRRIRVDYSITKRPHTPTPGVYLGKPTDGESGGSGYSRRRSPSPYYGGGGSYKRGSRYSRSRSRSRSYSPRRY